MNAATTLIMQGCACGLIAHPAVTDTVASTMCPAVDTPVACDAGPYVEFGAVLEQMAEQLQTAQPPHGAEPTVAAEAAKRNGHGARAACTDPEVDIQPAQDDDGDGDEEVDGSGSTALRQITVMAAGSVGKAPVQTRTMRRSMQDQTDSRSRAARQVEGVPSGSMAGEAPIHGFALVSAEPPGDDIDPEPAKPEPNDLKSTVPDDREEPTCDGSVGSVVPAPEPRVMPGPERRTTIRLHMRATAGLDGDTSAPPDEHAAAGMEELMTVETGQLTGGTSRTAAQVEPKNQHTTAPPGRDEPVRSGSLRSMGIPATETGMAPWMQEGTVAVMQERETAWPEGRTMVLPDMRGTADSDGSARVTPERLTTVATEEPMAIEPEQPAESQSRDEESRVSQQPRDRTSASVDARASQPEGTHMAMDQMNDSTVGRVGSAVDRPPADKALVRESVTVSTERSVGGRVRTAPHVEPENAHTSAKVGRDEPALNGSPRWADAPVTELSTAPRTPEQPEGTHMAMDEMNDSTVGRVGSAVDRPPADKALVRESVTVSTERPAGGRARTAPQVESENAHTSAKVGRDEPALNGSPRWADAPVTELSTAPRTPEQPEGTHMAMDEMNDSTVGRVGSAVDRPPADKALVRESVTVSTERPAGGRARTAPQVESENAHTSAKVGRDEPALNGSPRWADAPVTELSTAPRAPERQTAWPEGRTMVLPDGSAPVTPETLTTVATEEPMAIEPEQPAGTHVAMDQMNDSTAGQGARATGGPPVDQMPVRESVTVSTERPVGGRVRTAPQVEPQNALASAKVERDEPGSMGMPTAEHGMAPDMVDVAHGETAKTEMAQARQTAVRPTAPRREGAMTASRAVTVSRDWPEALVRSALVESLARRESEPNARPELAVVVGPIEGPDVSHTPQAARPALTEPAGWSVTRQIAAHVSARAAQGGGEFRARLVPEHLGSVQIRVRVVRGVCTADIRADDAEIARYIESHSSDLKVSLAEHGIDLSGLSVSSRSRAQEGWGVATLSHSESDWSAPSWNGANARQQYAAATFAGGNWRDGRGERRGAMMGSGAGMANPHSAVRQSGSPSPDEPIAARWARGFARIDYLA